MSEYKDVTSTTESTGKVEPKEPQIPPLTARQDALVTKRGNVYVAQFPGTRKALEITDRCKRDNINGTSGVSITMLFEELLKYVLVIPAGLQIEDFDDDSRFGDFEEVNGFLANVMNGRFPNKTQKSN